MRILLENGMDAVGGAEAIPSAVGSALMNDRPRCMDILLGHFNGDDDTRRHFARWRFFNTPILNLAVSLGSLATVSVLLAAGADETTVDMKGRLASEDNSEGATNPAVKEAIFRMLRRGAAFRASSWEWPDGTRALAGDEGGVDATLHGGRRVESLGVMIFRPRSKKTFMRLAGRCT